MAIFCWLTHNPCIFDMITTQMQVEGWIKNVNPRPHQFNFMDWTSVDLNTSSTSDKTHDRKFLLDGMVHHSLNTRWVHPPGKIFSCQLHRLISINAMFPKQSYKLMNIGQPSPLFSKQADINTLQIRFWLVRMRNNLNIGALILRENLCYKLVGCLNIRHWSQMYFMDGLTG